MSSRERRSGLPGDLRRLLRRDQLTGQVAIGLVGVLCVTAIVYGVGMASAKYHLADVGAWLSSKNTKVIVHANGLAGKVDGKAPLTSGMVGHRIKIVQDGSTVLLVDQDTGVVSRINPGQLKVEQSRPLGIGVQVVANAKVAYTVDALKGVVQQIDPMSLTALGQPGRLTAPLGQAGLDSQSRLWVPSPGTGQVVPFQAGRQLQPVTVGKAGDVLGLSIAAGVPVVTNSTDATALIIRPTGTQRVALPSTVRQAGKGGVRLPGTAEGQLLPLLGEKGSLTLLNTDTGSVTTVSLRVPKHRFGLPQILGPKVFIPDETAGALIVYNSATNKFEPTVPVSGKPGPLDVFVKDGLLWANDPNGDTAISLDRNGTLKRITKYDDKVPGGPRKPIPSQGAPGGDRGHNNGSGGQGDNGGNQGGNGPPIKPPKNNKPPAPNEPPRAPAVVAVGDQGTVTVTFSESPWRDIKPAEYVLRNGQGAPVANASPDRVPAGSKDRRFTVTGLSCDQPDQVYRVMVRYTDPKTKEMRDGDFGTGTSGACKEPGAPEVTSARADNGRVIVEFTPNSGTQAAKQFVLTDGEGTLRSNVSPATIGPKGPYRFVVSGLKCGTEEHAFKVVARFDKADHSKGEAASQAVTSRSCTAPGAPTGLRAAESNHAADLSWSGGGYDVKYHVTGTNIDTETTQTSAQVRGLDNDQQYTFTVEASNGAGGAKSSTVANLAYKPQGLRNANNNQTNTLIRPGPSRSGEVGRINRYQYIDITMICQVQGQQVTEDETGESSNIWNRIQWNGGIGYLSVTLMTGPRAPGGQVYEC